MNVELGAGWLRRQARRATRAVKNVGSAAVNVVKTTAKVAKNVVVIPTQLALHPNAQGLARAGRRTMSTASMAVRAPTHLALNITRVVAPGAADALYFVKRQIERAVAAIVRPIANKVLFKKSSGLHGDGGGSHPIIGMPKSTAIASVTAIASPFAASAGGAIGAPVFGVGAAGGAAIAVGLTAGVAAVVVNGIYAAFDEAKNKILGRGGVSEAKAEAQAAEDVSKGASSMTILIVGGVLAAFVVLAGRKK
jgi:hypothetical protein